MSNKKKIIAGACAVVAVAVAGTYMFGMKSAVQQTPVTTELLQQMDLKNTVSLTGVVETQTGRKVYSTLAYPVEEVNVEVGTVVSEGDVLAKLKTSDLELDIAQQQAAVNASKNLSAHQINVNKKAYENAKSNYENGLNASDLSAQQGVDQANSSLKQAEYGVDSAKLQVKNAEQAVRDARENYYLTRDQLDGAVDTAENALEAAEEALADAEAAYDEAVAGQADAEKKLTEQFNQTIASYEPALKEWGEQEYTYQIDIQTAKEKRDSVADALKEHQELHSTTPAEGEEELPSINECGKCKKLTGKLEKAKEEVLTAQETYTQKKSEFQAVESTVNQITANYQQQLASIKSSAGAAASGVAQAKGGVAQAEAQVDAAEDARHGATLAQIEQGIGTARRGVDSAEVQKDVAKAQREAAEQAAEMAKLQQEAAKNSIEQQIDSLKDSLVGSQISAQSNQAQEIAIQKMQNTLEDATITAPVSGVVTAVYAKVGEPGNGLLFVVEDTESLKIKTRIKEYDIANVQVGMPVIIKSDATGDKEISGTITYIAPAAVKTEAGTTKTTDGNSTVEFEAEVQVNEKNSGLRIGMNTRLTVMLEEKQNVIGVPYESIVEKADGSSVVYTVTQKGSEGKDAKTYVVTEVPVTTGLETDFYVEVSGNGVSDGMAVLTDPQSVAPGAEVTPDFVNGGDAVVGMSQGE